MGLLDRGWKEQWSLGRKRWLGLFGLLASGILGMAAGVAMGLEIESRIEDGLDAYAGFLYANWHHAALEGDTARAEALRPAAREQYARLDSWSRHQRWHVAELRFVDGCPRCALGTLDPILEDEPTHIPSLALAAQIADALDSTSLATERWRTLAARTDKEWTGALADYGQHANRLVAARRQAPAWETAAAQKNTAPEKVGTTAVGPDGGSSSGRGAPHPPTDTAIPAPSHPLRYRR